MGCVASPAALPHAHLESARQRVESNPTEVETLMKELLKNINTPRFFKRDLWDVKVFYTRVGAQHLGGKELVKALNVAGQWGLTDVAKDAYAARRNAEKVALESAMAETTIESNVSMTRSGLWKILNRAIRAAIYSELPLSSPFYIDIGLEEALRHQKGVTCPQCNGIGRCARQGEELQEYDAYEIDEILQNLPRSYTVHNRGLACESCSGSGVKAIPTFVVFISSLGTGSDKPLEVTCHNLAGEELACIMLDAEDEALPALRRKIVAYVAGHVFAAESALQIVLPSGMRLVKGESRTLRELLFPSLASI